MFFFGGGKCPNLGVVNVLILGVVNVLLANDSQSFLNRLQDQAFLRWKRAKMAKCQSRSREGWEPADSIFAGGSVQEE